MKKIIFVAPHPDDETLGCGGTILKHQEQGDAIHWLIVTSLDGLPGVNKQAIESRQNEISKVAAAYNFKTVHQLKMQTTGLDILPRRQIISAISEVFIKIKPEILYIPYQFDPHSDHQIVYDATISSSKPFRYPFIKIIRSYQTLSETEFSLSSKGCGFHPNYLVDVSNYLESKIEIMKLYHSEIGVHPFPRSEESIRALALLWGSSANCKYAEAFITLREIE